MGIEWLLGITVHALLHVCLVLDNINIINTKRQIKTFLGVMRHREKTPDKQSYHKKNLHFFVFLYNAHSWNYIMEQFGFI